MLLTTAVKSISSYLRGYQEGTFELD